MTLWCIESAAARRVHVLRPPRRPSTAARPTPTTTPTARDARHLAWQWERARSSIEAFGWRVHAPTTLEADDLLHPVRRRDRGRRKTLILTATATCSSAPTTRDILLQRARRQGPTSGADRSRGGQDRPREGAGLHRPARYPSDGLPGAKGIGAKTAADLLRRKGDLEHVILGAIREKPSVRRALIEQADEVRAFKDIATLRTRCRRRAT